MSYVGVSSHQVRIPLLRVETSLGDVTARIPLHVHADTESMRFCLDGMVMRMALLGTVETGQRIRAYVLDGEHGSRDWHLATLLLANRIAGPIGNAQGLYAQRRFSPITLIVAPEHGPWEPDEPQTASEDVRAALSEICDITKLPYRDLQKILQTSHTTLIGLRNDPQRTVRPLLAARINNLAVLTRRLHRVTGGRIDRIREALTTKVDDRSASDLLKDGDYDGAFAVTQRVLFPVRPALRPAPERRFYSEPSKAIDDVE